MTISFVICGLLYVVNLNFEATVLHGFWDTKPERYFGHDLDLFGSRDVIFCVTIGIWGYILVVNFNQPSVSHSVWDIKFKDIAVMALTFRVHVTSWVTWPLDSQYGVSYRWSTWTDSLSDTVSEILSFKDIGVTTLTFHVHVTSSVTWSLDSMCSFILVVNMNRPCISHGCWDIELQKPWPFGVTWRRQSRDHWTRDTGYAVSYRWSFEIIALSRITVEILCQTVSHAYSNWKCMDPHFVLGGKIQGYSILYLYACSRSLDRSFELLTVTIGPRALLLWYLDLPIENALRGWKIGAKYRKGHRTLTP